MCSEDGHEVVPHRDWVLEYDRILKEVKAQLKKQGDEDRFFDAKVRRIRTAHVNMLTTVIHLLDYIYHFALCVTRRAGMVSR